MVASMDTQGQSPATSVGKLAVAIVVLPVIWYAVSLAVTLDHGSSVSTLMWVNQAGSGLRAACTVLLAGLLWFLASRQSSPRARQLLSIAGALFLGALLLRVGIAAYTQRDGGSFEVWKWSNRIGMTARLIAVVAMSAVAWRDARTASLVALGIEAFFGIDGTWNVLPSAWHHGNTMRLLYFGLAVVAAVANVVQLRAIVADARCDSKPLLRSSYDQLSVSMALRVVVAVVSCLVVVTAFGSNGRQLKWLLPISIGGAWLANLWGLIGATRLVFADTGYSGRVAVGAGAMIWAVVVQIPMLVVLWNLVQGHTDHFDREGLTNFQYAAPIVNALGLLLLVSAVQRAAVRAGQFELAESTLASAIIFGIMNVATVIAQYGLGRVKSKGEAMFALAIAAGCGLAAVVTLMRIFSRARDARDQTPQPLPTARVV